MLLRALSIQERMENLGVVIKTGFIAHSQRDKSYFQETKKNFLDRIRCDADVCDYRLSVKFWTKIIQNFRKLYRNFSV